MTTVQNALKQWESDSGKSVATGVEVLLYNKRITKLDGSLNGLENCEHLSLSTNMIDRLVPLAGCKKLKTLSIGRNTIRRLEKLDDIGGTLEKLWCSYNQITSLDGLSKLTKLQELFISNNNISDWSELEKLAANTELRDILLVGNPICNDMSKEEYRIEVLRHMSANKNLTKIDNNLILPAEREAAAS